MSAAPIWWSDTGNGGLVGYIGAGNDGLEFSRHGFLCTPGLWDISITGFAVRVAAAVVDDFGNLVHVQP